MPTVSRQNLSPLAFHEIWRIIYTFDPHWKEDVNQSQDQVFTLYNSARLRGNDTIAQSGAYYGKALDKSLGALHTELLSNDSLLQENARQILANVYQVYLNPKAEYTYYVIDKLLQFIKQNVECINLIYQIKFLSPEVMDNSNNPPRIQIDLSLGAEKAQRLLNILFHKFLPILDIARHTSNIYPPYSKAVNAMLYYGQGIFSFKKDFINNHEFKQNFDKNLALLQDSKDLALSEKFETIAYRHNLFVYEPLLSTDAAIVLNALEKSNKKIKRDGFLYKHSVVFDDMANPYILTKNFLGQGSQGSVKIAQRFKDHQQVAVKITIFNEKSFFASKAVWDNEKFFCQYTNNLLGSAIITNPKGINKGYIFMLFHEGVKPFKDLFDFVTVKDFKFKTIKSFLLTARAIIQAINKLHEKNIIHADVHTGNLIKKSDGTCEIVDYGLAVLLKDGQNVAEVAISDKRKYMPHPDATFDRQSVIYSPAYDAYMLGNMLIKHLGRVQTMFEALHVHNNEVWSTIKNINHKIIRPLLVVDRQERASLPATLEKINNLLEQLEQKSWVALPSELLFMAVIKDETNIVQTILQHFPTLINFRDQNNYSIKDLASFYQRPEILTIIQKVRIDLLQKSFPILKAIENNQLSAPIQQMLRESPDLLNITNINGENLIASACEKGDTASVEILISLGANLKWKSLEQETLLHLAAKSGNYALVKKLVDSAFIKVDAVSLHGTTALHQAIFAGQDLVAEYLLSVGAKLTAGHTDNLKVLDNVMEHKQVRWAYDFYMQLESKNRQSLQSLRKLFFDCIRLDNALYIKKIWEEHGALHNYLISVENNYRDLEDDHSFEIALGYNAKNVASCLLDLNIDLENLIANKEYYMLEASKLGWLDIALQLEAKTSTTMPVVVASPLEPKQAYVPSFSSIKIAPINDSAANHQREAPRAKSACVIS